MYSFMASAPLDLSSLKYSIALSSASRAWVLSLLALSFISSPSFC
jgi:hypothetical protein